MTVGVVLAAGSSSRLGRPKQLLELAGRPLLQHVVDAVAASCLDEVVVVLGHEAETIEAALDLPPSVRVVVNPDHAGGQSTSLRCGLAALSGDVWAAVLVLGDQPGIEPWMIDRIADELRSGAPAARAVFGGVPGHPVAADRSEWPGLAGVTGDQGARGFFEAHPERVSELTLGDAPLPDVDTWEDYEMLRHRWEER